ncbi:MAG: hypothetical protein LBV35_02325 [Acinetobacter sp.]|jgi:hypothetical protein|uniref:hypothetical protein n=1 Tax=Acinetobacter sp. TaxID=472 RepID=UPI00284A7BA8|nr:hypothetical protein [Acinetobacter sp.]MDR3027275.1 hypothetical protein [Acinetobacter sp.]
MSKAKTTYKIKHKDSGKVFSIYLFVNTEVTGSRDLGPNAEPLFRSSSQFFDENHNKIDIQIPDDSGISIGSKILVGSAKLEYEVICID